MTLEEERGGISVTLKVTRVIGFSANGSIRSLQTVFDEDEHRWSRVDVAVISAIVISQGKVDVEVV